jgi:hypothetical protein
MLTRRGFFKIAGTGAVAAIGAQSLDLGGVPAHASQTVEQFSFGSGAPKPVPTLYSPSPAGQSEVETQFWVEIMAEHGVLLASLLPGDDLAPLRRQAVEFNHTFETYLDQVRATPFDNSNYQAMNRQTIGLVQPFIDFKHQIHDLQDSGQIHSFVYPSLAKEVAAEAEHFVWVLQRLSTGDADRDLREAVPFWLTGMEGHALLMGHMLDPKEMQLMDTAHQTAARFGSMRDAGGADLRRIGTELDAFIAFKEQARNGIDVGAIDSIIHPAVADHMRREAVKARDELHFFAGV